MAASTAYAAKQPAVRIVLALGGNALVRRGQQCCWGTQVRNVRLCVRAMQRAGLFDAGREEEILITHGNGPQVGDLAKRLAEQPLHELVACTQASIAHMLETEMRRVIGTPQPPGSGDFDTQAARRLQVCSLMTHVAVDSQDPAFDNPTKFVGLTLNREQADSVPKEWTVKKDGSSWRRVVPSPKPREILQLPTIERLAQPRPVVSPSGVTSLNKTILICAGGGGIPVDVNNGEPLDAVVDKDRTSALLARRVRAHRLIILTDVSRVWVSPEAARSALSDCGDEAKLADDVEVSYVAPGSHHQLHEPSATTAPPEGYFELSHISVERLRELHDLGEFPEGSMEPKVEAVIDYMTGSLGDPGAAPNPEQQERGGWQPRSAAIGRLDDLPEILAGRSGTHVFAGRKPVRSKISRL